MSAPLRSLSLLLLASCAALPAGADIELTLKGRSAAASAAKPAAPGKPAAKPASKPAPVASDAGSAPIRRALASRSMPPVLGIIRRGSVPVLPSADGTPPATLPSPAPQPAPAAQVAVNAYLGRVIAAVVDVHKLPDPRSQWVGRLQQGQQVAIVSQWTGWYAVIMGDGSQAYVPGTHVELLPYQVRSVSPTAPPPPEPAFPAPAAGAPTLAKAVIEEAFRYEGVPYVYGGNTERGLDCSGLVKNCFAAQGVELPRRASEQAMIGTPVPLDQLQPGDRLYFSVKKQYDHTGIYLGDGAFIHASMSRKKVAVDQLTTPLYAKSLAAARRL